MRRAFLDGAEAIVRAAIYAGCRFYAGYPITPATPILLKMFRSMPKPEGVVIQTEDEIAAIAMCIAASSAGVKAMTATSGPGISLYSEHIGLALMMEIPLVIVDVQRLGPSTGGATTGAEGDVMFARWGTSGGMPVVILSPGDIASLFRLTVHAFNLAERLRTPIFLLTSKDLVMSHHTMDEIELALPEVVNRVQADESLPFIPFRWENSEDIPPFLPMGSHRPVRLTSSMHDEKGYLTKSPDKVERKTRHLIEKILKHPHWIETVQTDLEEGADTLLLGYGVNVLPCREAVRDARREGKKVSFITIESLFPIPEQTLKNFLKNVKRLVIPELNPGLYADAIRYLLPKETELLSLVKINGEPFSGEEIRTRGGF